MEAKQAPQKRFPHTNRPGFWIGFIDFFTAGFFLLFYMPLGGPTLFLYTLVWMARIAEELKAKAIALGIEGPYTSWRHMFWWNTLGILLCGPAVATYRFFDTLNKVEDVLNRQAEEKTE